MNAAAHIAPVAIHGWSPSTYVLLFIAIINALGVGGAIGLWIKHRGAWLKTETEASAAKRRQTDEVALDLVETLTARIAALEAAQVVADAHTSALRHELRNVEGSIDGLLLQVLKRVDPSIAPDLIGLFADWRAERRREAAESRGDLRNTTQAHISAARVVADAQGEAA